MNKKLRSLLACTAAAVCALPLALGGCAAELAAPPAATPLTYTEREQKGEDFETLLAAANGFAAHFAPEAVKFGEKNENSVVSPVSVYMALALAAECASGETAEELYAALNVPRETVRAEFSDFYRSLTAEYEDARGKVEARASLGNSVWVQTGTPTRKECLSTLAEKYFCYSYSADFRKDNEGANRAVRDFVKKQTKGLIDQDFALDEETLFTLINTLYLKEIWNSEGDELSLTEASYDFRQGDGSVKTGQLMQSYYAEGRAFDGGNFTSFFARTAHGYKLHLMVPKEGFSAGEIFTEESLTALANADYRPYDEESGAHYSTRCLFPAFDAKFDGEIEEILQKMGVERFFRDPRLFPEDGCTFETLTEEEVFCDKVQHVAKLKVERRGIEGAAVTVAPMNGATGAPEVTIREDFVVDRAFAFVLTDPYGSVLFSGVVNRI